MYRLRCSAICSMVDISGSRMTRVPRLLGSACALSSECDERRVTLPSRAIGPSPLEGEKLRRLPARDPRLLQAFGQTSGKSSGRRIKLATSAVFWFHSQGVEGHGQHLVVPD